MTRHLVIFARTPQFGRVKRRLARDVGMAEATHFYRASLGRQIEMMARDPRWTVWLFVTPDTEMRHPAWRGAVPPPRVRPQGRGDLGHFFFNDTATTEIYTRSIVGSEMSCIPPFSGFMLNATLHPFLAAALRAAVLQPV